MPADRLMHPRLGHSQKVSSLSHLEARVWQQYILSADDFGVMRYSPLVVQDDNDALAREPIEVIHACLARLVEVGLICAFEHQHNRYLFQGDWQDFQKVEYPRVSFQPKPPVDFLKTCTPRTRKLFGKHPGGTLKHSPKVSQRFSEDSPSNTRARTRETANGKRLTANGKDRGSGGKAREFRPTPDEIKRGRQWRAALGRCPHDPPCGSTERCIGFQIRQWRKELEGVA